MLKNLQRDLAKPLRVPHPNLVKNTTHSYSIGHQDWTAHRQTSTNKHFYNEKERSSRHHIDKHKSNKHQLEYGYNQDHDLRSNSVSMKEYKPFFYGSSHTESSSKDQPRLAERVH